MYEGIENQKIVRIFADRFCVTKKTKEKKRNANYPTIST